MKSLFSLIKNGGMIAIMKALVFVLSLLVGSLASAQTHVKFDLSAPFFNALPASNRVVQLQPLTPFRGNLITYTSSVAGVFYHSNAAIGDYAGSIRPRGTAGEIVFQITVTATNLGVVNAHEITSLTGQQTYPTTGRASWSIAASDTRYVRQGQGGIAVAAGTNVTATTNSSLVTLSSDPPTYVAAGTNIVVVTNGNLLTVHGTATGSGGGGTGIATNSGTGTNNVFTSPIIAVADGITFLTNVADEVGVHYNSTAAGFVFSNAALYADQFNSFGQVIAATTIRAVGGFTGNGSGLTNVPSVIVTNVARLRAEQNTNAVIFVVDYWGTNGGLGNGHFIHTTNTSVVDNGTVFAADVGGYWKRVRPSTNLLRLDWFGLRDINPDAPHTIYDAHDIISNACFFAGRFTTIIVPNIMFASSELTLSNKIGLVIRSEGGNYGQQMQFGNRGVPIWAYVGATNGNQITMWSCFDVTVQGIGFDPDTPAAMSLLGRSLTNHAIASIVHDQAATFSQISTHNKIKDCYFNASRNTNVTYYAIRNSPTSANNCEQLLIENCGGNGGGYWNQSTGELKTTGNQAVAIHNGNSVNARGLDVRNCSFSGFRHNLWLQNGDVQWSGGGQMGGGCEYDFKLDAWIGSVEISGSFTENSRAFAYLGQAASSVGNFHPIIFRDCVSETSVCRDTNTALILMANSANLKLDSCVFTGTIYQRMFDVTNTATATLISDNNVYPTNHIGALGMTNFGYAWTTENLKYDDVNSEKGVWWNNRAATVVMHPQGKTNFVAWHLRGSTFVVNPTNAALHIGQAPSALSAEKFVFHRPDTASWKGVFGDGLIHSRYLFDAQSGGSTYLDIHSTNSTSANVRVYNDTAGSYVSLTGGNGFNELYFDGALFRIRKSGSAVFQIGTDSAISFSPTNNSFTVNSTNSRFHGHVNVSSNLSVGFNGTGYFGLIGSGNVTNAAGSRVAYLTDITVPDINAVLNSGNDAAGESLIGVSTLRATNVYVHRLWNTNEVGYVPPPTNSPTDGYALLSSGAHSSRWSPISASAGGSTTQIQFNDGGSLNGDLRFIYDKNLDELRLGGALVVTGDFGFALDIKAPSLFNSYVNMNSYMVTNAHVIAAQDHATGTASNLTVKAGKTTSGTGGNLNLQTGDATTGTIGSINVTVGALPPSPATGGTVGHITLQSGDGNADKRGGNIYLYPGNGDGGGGGTNWLGESGSSPTYNRLLGITIIEDARVTTLSVSGAETNSTITSGVVVADANGKRSAVATVAGETNLVRVLQIGSDASGQSATNFNVVSVTNLLERLEYVEYATGSNLTLNFAYGGGRLLLTNNACVTNITGLSSNVWKHTYQLLTSQDANGTWTLYFHTNFANFQGGTNGIFPIATNAGAENTFYLETSYFGTNVNIGQGMNWRKL